MWAKPGKDGEADPGQSHFTLSFFMSCDRLSASGIVKHFALIVGLSVKAHWKRGKAIYLFGSSETKIFLFS